MKKRPSDAAALVAILAWERCDALAHTSPDACIREAWRRDADAAWETVQRWLGKSEPATNGD